jgi:hypothetical protein
MSSSHAPSAEPGEEQSCSAPSAERAYFFMTGTSGSDLLPRLLTPFLKLGLAPYRVHASSEHGTGEEMSVEFRFTGLTAATVERLAAQCRAVIGVRSVLTVTE